LKKIRMKIEGERGYDILVGHNILHKIGQHIKPLHLGNSAFIITSPTIGKLYLKPLVQGLKSAGFKNIQTNLVPDGEKFKSFSSYQRLMGQMLKFSGNGEKKIFIINMGGGVIGDLGGFVAATFKRGTDYIQVPTTLLAFVDCGIGGKTGIDFNGVKNIVGAFHQPKLVYADLSLLKTLNKREMKSGFAEVVKYGVIHSPTFFEFIENNIDKVFSLDKKVIEQIAVQSYSIKADIVRKDEFDTKGIRMQLNYGHTIGHAVESASRYAYRHGEAISLGMVCASDIAVKLGILEKDTSARIESLLIKIGLPVRIKNHNIDEIMNFFWRDKKFVNGKNRFVMATKIGKTKIIEDIQARIITDVIRNRFSSI